MSNPDLVEGGDDLQPPCRSAGGWNSVVGTLGVILTGLFIGWNSLNSAEPTVDEPVVESRTVIRWRQTPVFSLAWSPDSRRLAASCFGPVVRVWDRETGAVSSHEGGTEQPRFVLGWSGDGRQLMVSGLDLPIESWDLFADPSDDGSPSVGRPLDRVATSEALTKSTGARPIRLWGPSDRRFGFMTQEGQAANSIAFSCSGRFLATGGIEGRVKIHDATSGVLLRKIEVDPRGISAITFSADGSKVATSGPGPTRIWDVESGREVHRLGNVMSGSATLGFSPDGSKIAVANWDGTIVIWDLTTESPLLKLHTDHAQILSLAWSPDGKTLASGGYDSSVKVWELATPTLKTAAR